MISASIDTDILIHLYLSKKQHLFFDFFDELYLHEFLYEQELKKKNPHVYKQVTEDVLKEKLTIISTHDLIRFGVKKLFEDYLMDYKLLFDQGELHAVALAKVMGLCALISDDTKRFGPHDTLVKEQIKDVIPIAFYELLYLKYLIGELSVEGLFEEFNEVTSISMKDHPMNFVDRIMRTTRRFSKAYGTSRDQDWIQLYCSNHGVDYKLKMNELKTYLKKIERQ